MASSIETIDQSPTVERGAWPGDGPVQPDGPRDPGLVWRAGLRDERASAGLMMRDLLSTWRSAERLLTTVPEGGREWSLLRAQVDALRFAYQRIFSQIRRGSTER